MRGKKCLYGGGERGGVPTRSILRAEVGRGGSPGRFVFPKSPCFFFFLPRVVMSGGGGERLLICALETVKHRRLGANLRNEVCCLERACSALNSLTPLMGIPLPFLSTL